MIKIINITLILLLGLYLGGCGKNKPSIPESEILNNKELAHIVFVNSTQHSTDIFEFSPNDFKAKHIADISTGEKSIYSVKEGMYYFYSALRFKKILPIDVKAGQTYLIDANLNYHDEQRISLKRNLLKSKCNDMLDLFLMEDWTEDDSENDMFTNNEKNKIKYYKGENTLINIKCKNNKVLSIEDEYFIQNAVNQVNLVNNVDINDYKNFDLVEIEKDKLGQVDKSISEDIKSYFPLWKQKFKPLNIPSHSDILFLKINNIVNKKYLKSFSGISFINEKNEIENKKVINNFSKKIMNKNINSSKENTLIVNYTINTYDDGSQLNRYLLVGMLSNVYKEASTLKVTFELRTYNGEKVSSFEISEVVTQGILGGINFTQTNIINLAEKYIKTNFIKK